MISCVAMRTLLFAVAGSGNCMRTTSRGDERSDLTSKFYAGYTTRYPPLSLKIPTNICLVAQREEPDTGPH